MTETVDPIPVSGEAFKKECSNCGEVVSGVAATCPGCDGTFRGVARTINSESTDD